MQNPRITTPLTPRREIRLQSIHYTYPTALHKPVPENYTLAITGSIGIAGKSSAGKNTLMNLLLDPLQPQQGSLSVDGKVINDSNIAAWPRAIGYVPQHIYLADTSVAQNIAFGVKKKDIDMQAVERAARAAQIHDFVTHESPEGYDTPVGDRGIRLSGGQRQRVGIARALYRSPSGLFFDEATSASALDAQTEKAMNEAVHSLSGSKTVVLVTHKKVPL